MSPKPNSSSFQGISPVVLSSPFTIIANNSAIPQSDRLSYPFRKAIVIDEIRITLRTSTFFGSALALNLGSIVSAKFMLGQVYLMRSPVPVWLLGTMMVSSQEEGIDNQVSTSQAVSQYRWRLPNPLYVEAGQVLSTVLSRGPDGYGTISGQITYVGRTVAPDQPRPRLFQVPYACSWVTTLTNTYQQSNEYDLFNPFSKTLRVQRLTGRLLAYGQGGAGTEGLSSVYRMTPGTAGSGPTILMNDSWGGKMVNNNTGPGDVFDALRAAWTVDSDMPAKGVYEVRVWNLPTTQMLHVGLIGSREEQL